MSKLDTSVTLTYDKNPQLAHEHFGENQTSMVVLSEEAMERIDQFDNYFIKKFSITILETSNANVGAKDFELLYLHNYPRIKAFMDTMIFHKAFNILSTAFLDYLTVWKQSNDQSCLVVQLLESRPKEQKIEELKNSWTYEIAYSSPWACNADIETEHLQLTQKTINWYETSCKESTKADKCIFVILTMILLHNTDGIELTNKSQIESIQLKYVNLLNKYLKSHLNSELAYGQLHKGMMLIHDTQRMHELSQQRLKLSF